ncbi:MAG: hypothetical protein ABGY11_14410 [Candidatus Thioglobus sp.]|jgi:hypothetical protein
MSKEQWIEDRERLWEDIGDKGEYCKGCIHNEVTRDAYGTGDSPTMRECTGYADVCPGVESEWVDGMYEGEYDESQFEEEI